MKLSRREKYSVYFACAFIGMYLVIQFVIFPFIDKRNRVERNLEVKAAMLREMVALKAEHNSLNKQAELSKIRFSQRKSGFTLFSFLDKLAGEAGIKEKVAYMKPSKIEQKNSPYKLSTVEMKIQGVTLSQLSPFLHMVETSENSIYVHRMSITKTSAKEGLIDAILQVETFES